MLGSDRQDLNKPRQESKASAMRLQVQFAPKVFFEPYHI